jgi:sulfite oxidase
VNKSREQTRKRLKEFEKRDQNFTPLTRPTEFPYQTWESYEEHWKKFGPRDVDE